LNRIGTVHRRLLYCTLAVLFVSGASWALSHHLTIRSYPGEPALMKIHGAAAMVALVLIGALLAAHVPAGWRLRRSRPSGMAMLIAAGLLAASGWLLYYLGDETAREVSSYAHLALGLALPVALLFHLAAKNPSRKTDDPVRARKYNSAFISRRME
jgi:hypothetical protein